WAPSSPNAAASGSAPTPTESSTTRVTVMGGVYGQERPSRHGTLGTRRCRPHPGGCDNGPMSEPSPGDPGTLPPAEDLRAQVVTRVRALAPDARRLLVAVSGGRDSVAALRLLHGSEWQVAAAHFDHRLRPDAAEDAAFVQATCDTLGVRLHVGSADVAAIAKRRGWNVEDAARRLRYAFLHRVAAGEEPKAGRYDAIVVAHTRDDQAETVLLQLFRGAAFPSGMAARQGLVLRPLLDVDRAALTTYLVSIGQAWREDA